MFDYGESIEKLCLKNEEKKIIESNKINKLEELEKINKEKFKKTGLFKNYKKLDLENILFKKDIKLKNFALFIKGNNYKLSKFQTFNFFYDPIIYENKKLGFYFVKVVNKNKNKYLLLILHKKLFFKNLINSILILFHTKQDYIYNDILYQFMEIKKNSQLENLLFKYNNSNFCKTSLIINKEDLRENLFKKENLILLNNCEFEMIRLKN